MVTLAQHITVPLSGTIAVVGSRIAGVDVVDPGDPTADVFDPATGVATRRVSLASAATVDRAVAAATDAWRSSWRDSSQKQRFALVHRLHELVMDRRDDLVNIIVSEHGKSLADAQGEFDRAVDGLDSTLSFPVALQGSFSGQVGRGIDTHSMPYSLGVVTTITPFNFPLMVPLWGAAAALVCGNTVIHKPSPRVPSAANLLAELIEQAGAPTGVYNVIQGDAVAVNALLDHPGVSAATFVGSTPVAKHVYERGTQAGKRVQALGSAKNHAVVMPDCDLAFAADSLVAGAYGSSGQRCMAVTLAVAVGPVADALRDALVERIPALKVGPGFDEGVDLGPVISRESQQRIVGLVTEGEAQGVEVVIDGRVLAGAAAGFFVGPTLMDKVRPGQAVYDNELFGPVLGIVRVDSLAEAIAMIADNPYGNGAAIFTSDGATARIFEREVEAGMIGVNVPVPVPVNSFTTGGWKGSVFGAHGLLGPEMYRFFTRTKMVTTRWPESGAKSMGMAFNPGT
jgi:malonate-semialdehyde dehydrogenase (acetylating)/methylmalonate-semialdehyde dehydrogenase